MEERTLVNETIDFLNETSPETLQDLQVRYPDARKIILLGIPGGSDDIALNVLVDLTLEVTQKIIIESQKQDKKIVKRLYRVKNIEIAGDIISLVSGSALFLLIAKGWEPFSYIINGLALAGVILPRFTHFYLKTLSPEKNLFELRQEMNDLQSEAEVIYDNLRLCKIAGYTENVNGDSARDFVRRGNVLSQKIRSIFRKIGVERNLSASR